MAEEWGKRKADEIFNAIRSYVLREHGRLTEKVWSSLAADEEALADLADIIAENSLRLAMLERLERRVADLEARLAERGEPGS